MREEGREHYNLKNRVAYVVFAILVILIFIVICLIFHFKKNRENAEISDLEVTLVQDGVVNKSWQVDDLDLIPLSRTEYTLVVHGTEAGQYLLTLAYTTDEACPLAEYLTVTVKYGEETFFEPCKLSALLEGEPIAKEFAFATNEDKEFTVVYEMGDYGNEVQGATAKFELTLTAKSLATGEENA